MIKLVALELITKNQSKEKEREIETRLLLVTFWVLSCVENKW